MPKIFAAYLCLPQIFCGILSLLPISVANTSMPQISAANTSMTRVSSFENGRNQIIISYSYDILIDLSQACRIGSGRLVWVRLDYAF